MTRQAAMFVLIIFLMTGGSVIADETERAASQPERLYDSSCSALKGDRGPGSFPESRLLVQAGLDLAQLDELRPGSGRQHGPVGRRHRRHLEQLRILKLLELLELREDQELEFLQAFRGLRRDHRELGEERGKLLDQLSESLESDPANDSKTNELIDLILENERKRHQLHNSFIEQSRQILTGEQLGKLIIFQERFEAQLLENVRFFRAQQEYERRKSILDPDG